MKKREKISCPLCKCARLLDADLPMEFYEVIPEDEIIDEGIGYVIQKCHKCGRKIAVRPKYKVLS